MKKNIFITLLVWIMGTFAFTSCHIWKTKAIEPNDELFEYTCFGKGSYWVYEDSATHMIDSIWVVTDPEKSKAISSYNSESTDVLAKTFSNKYCYENIAENFIDTFLFRPTINPYVYAEEAAFPPTSLKNYETYSFPIVKDGINDPKFNCIREYYALSYINMESPIRIGDNCSRFKFAPRYDSFYDTYLLNDKRYNNVKRFVIISMDYYYYEPRLAFDSIITYWAKNIGVIKWECYDTIGSTIMNLKRYDVKNTKKKELYKR